MGAGHVSENALYSETDYNKSLKILMILEVIKSN